MTSVNLVSGTSTSSNSQDTSQTNNALGKEDFLKLLVTQLSNQDPLSPMKNEEFVAQLAQFSSLEQLVSVNDRLDALAMGQVSQSGSSAVSFIGKDVRAMADWIDYSGEGSTNVGYELVGDAKDVAITITNENGDVIRRVELKDQKKGEQSWTWDGTNKDGSPVAAGTYTVSVTAKDDAGSTVQSFAVSTGRISGIAYGNGYPELMIGDHKLALSDVIEVLEK